MKVNVYYIMRGRQFSRFGYDLANVGGVVESILAEGGEITGVIDSDKDN